MNDWETHEAVPPRAHRKARRMLWAAIGILLLLALCVAAPFFLPHYSAGMGR